MIKNPADPNDSKISLLPTFETLILTLFLLLFIKLSIKPRNAGNKMKNSISDRKLKQIPSFSLIASYFRMILWQDSRPNQFLSYMARHYDIAQTTALGKRFVLINDMQLGKEAFSKSVCSGRPAVAIQTFCAQGFHGIINTQGDQWKKHRKFTIQHLREFGFNTKSMESHIHAEIKDVIKAWRERKGKTFCPQKAFYIPLMSTIWSILAGERASAKSQYLVQLVCNAYGAIAESTKVPAIFFFGLPFSHATLTRLARWMPLFPLIRRILRSVEELQVHLGKEIAARKKVLDADKKLTNLIETYLKEIEGTKDPNSVFYGKEGELNLMAVTFDFFMAGGDTTSGTLAWCMLHLVRNPQVQEKIRREIRSVIGIDRLPSLTDRINCPYTQAFIWESLRFTPFAPASLPHETTADCSIGPYFVKKNTIVIFNIYGIHHDPKIWGDPENFRPERFLDESGKRFLRNDMVCVFSVGQRRCPGEHLALDNLFLFISAICQHFILKPDPSLKGVPELRELKSLFNAPDVFDIVAVESLTEDEIF